MTSRRIACQAILGIVFVAFAWAGPARGEPPADGRRGAGLLPTRETPSVSGGQTRDEMLRRFDLDSNGRIDEGELKAARTRMRRDRMEALQNSGVDPLTGRLRGASPTDESAAEPRDGDDLIFPPANPPDVPQRKPEAEKKPLAQPAPKAATGTPPVITGGVRAGAPAVRPGYGATGPKQELNAGRPRTPPQTPGAIRVRAGTQPATARPTAPRSGLFPQGSTQPTAEDFGP